jgi:hypothetical protein
MSVRLGAQASETDNMHGQRPYKPATNVFAAPARPGS